MKHVLADSESGAAEHIMSVLDETSSFTLVQYARGPQVTLLF